MPDGNGPKASPPKPGEPHFIIELIDKTHQGLDAAKSVSTQLAVSSGARAFRGVQTVNKMPLPLMNAAGNLRGMVVSARARTIYNFSTNIASKLQKYDSALGLVGMALELQKDTQRIESLWNPDIPSDVRAQKLTLIFSTAILRAVTGVVPTAAHLTAKALEGYCDVAGLFIGQDSAKLGIDSLRAADLQISTAFQEIFDADNIYNFSNVAGAQAFNWVDAHIHLR